MTYTPNTDRYDNITYRRVGQSGLKLPPVSLGLWHNFGAEASPDNCRTMIRDAFDRGITHFDLANNYGPPPGAAEKTFGDILRTDLAPFRDELIIATKAGYDMWAGPYGDLGSRKHLIASLDQSLKRIGVDYVDIFYHHRPDPDTPLIETMGALNQIVKSGKALYVGLSNYPARRMIEAASILWEQKTPFIVNQVRYHMFDRWIEDELIDTAGKSGTGLTVYSPLAQGVLTDRYLDGIPNGSRASGTSIFLTKADITSHKVDKVRKLKTIADERGQSIAQLALAFVLRHPVVASVIIGASRTEQIRDCLNATQDLPLSDSDMSAIESILAH